jgi:hypothetical protein
VHRKLPISLAALAMLVAQGGAVAGHSDEPSGGGEPSSSTEAPNARVLFRRENVSFTPEQVALIEDKFLACLGGTGGDGRVAASDFINESWHEVNESLARRTPLADQPIALRQVNLTYSRDEVAQSYENVADAMQAYFVERDGRVLGEVSFDLWERRVAQVVASLPEHGIDETVTTVRTGHEAADVPTPSRSPARGTSSCPR